MEGVGHQAKVSLGGCIKPPGHGEGADSGSWQRPSSAVGLLRDRLDVSGTRSQQPTEVGRKKQAGDSGADEAQWRSYRHPVRHAHEALPDVVEQVLVPHGSERSAYLLINEPDRSFVLRDTASHGPRPSHVSSSERDLIAEAQDGLPCAGRSRLAAGRQRGAVSVHVQFEVEQPLGRTPHQSHEFDDRHTVTLCEERLPSALHEASEIPAGSSLNLRDAFWSRLLIMRPRTRRDWHCAAAVLGLGGLLSSVMAVQSALSDSDLHVSRALWQGGSAVFLFSTAAFFLLRARRLSGLS